VVFADKAIVGSGLRCVESFVEGDDCLAERFKSKQILVEQGKVRSNLQAQSTSIFDYPLSLMGDARVVRFERARLDRCTLLLVR
jgi:hypothetical protein